MTGNYINKMNKIKHKTNEINLTPSGQSTDTSSSKVKPNVNKLEEKIRELERTIEEMKIASEEQIEHFNDEINIKDIRILQLEDAVSFSESKIKSLTKDIKSLKEDNSTNKTDSIDNIEGKIIQLIELLNKKNEEIKENQTYSIKLISIINEQKKTINEYKSKEKNNECNKLLLYETKIENLKNEIETKEKIIRKLKRENANIRKKYIKIMNENKKEKENKIVPSKSTGNIKKKSEREHSPFLPQNTNKKVIQSDTFMNTKDKQNVSLNTSSIINNQIVLKDDLNWFMNNI